MWETAKRRLVRLNPWWQILLNARALVTPSYGYIPQCESKKVVICTGKIGFHDAPHHITHSAYDFVPTLSVNFAGAYSS
jgi:hypothetical protein